MWTENEINLIKANYSDKAIDELLVLLPKRTPHALRNRASKLGVSKRSELLSISARRARANREDVWTAEEIRALREGYSVIPIGDLIGIVGRSRNAIHGKAFDLGLDYYAVKANLSLLSQEQLAYLAGLIDGEGYILKNGRMGIGMTHKETIVTVYNWLKGAGFNPYLRLNRMYSGRRRPMHYVELGRKREALLFLQAINKFLITKNDFLNYERVHGKAGGRA